MLSNLTLCLAASASYNSTTTVVGYDVHILITEVDNIKLVAIRGTEPDNLIDWIRDFDVVPVDNHTLGICHQGFLTGAISAFNYLQPLLLDKQYALVGHSLGGALAILTGALLAKAGIAPLQLTTFGAPRTTIMDMVGSILEPVPGDRFWNGDDPVPDLPTWPFICDRLETKIGTPAFNIISDHMIDSYYNALLEIS